ncbi:hypothetical protein, partial [Chryseobacterium muglaense]
GFMYDGAGGNGADTYKGQEAYDILQDFLNPASSGNSLSPWMKANIGEGFSFIQEEPSPIRKYLKNKTSFSSWGIETTEIQYQLDHNNTILELKQIINQTEEFTDKIDNVLDWTPAISGAKGVYDFIKEGAKSLSPPTLILALGSTTISIENSKAKDFLGMYRNIQNNYIDLHSKNPTNMKGITVNIDMIKGPQNHVWSRYRFYDIFTHRYLGGETFE